MKHSLVFKTPLFLATTIAVSLISTDALAYVADLKSCQPPVLDNICTASGLTVGTPECSKAEADAKLACSEISGIRVWFYGFWKKIETAMTKEAAASIIGLLSFVIVAGVTYLRSKIKSFGDLLKKNETLNAQNRFLTSRLADPLINRLPEIETRAVNVLFLGIGGSGKTSLVHALSASKNAKPSVATADNHLFSIAHEVNIAKKKTEQHHRELVRIFLSDHVGQNFDSIPKTDFFANDALQKLPKCMVVVVDIEEPRIANGDTPTNMETVTERAQKHIETYNTKLIQMITGGMGNEGKVIIFINKLDILPNLDAEARNEVKELFSDVIQGFSRFKGLEVEVICGSANTGLGINACTLQPNGFVLPNLYQSIRAATAKVEG